MRKGMAELIGLAAIGFVGCAGQKPIPMDNGFWNKSGKSVEVVMAKYPHGAAHRAGGQGVLDQVINNAVTGGLDKYLSEIELFSFDALRDTLTAKLKTRGFQANVLPERVDFSTLPKFKATNRSNAYDKDLSQLNTNGKADYMLIIDVTQFGTIRNYYGFIPLNAPKALFVAHGVLVDAKTNLKVWEDFTNQALEVQSPWDEPPEYPHLSMALKNAMDDAKLALIESLF